MTTHYLIESIKHSRDGIKSWWRPDAKGYTRDITAAGRYSRVKAEKICREANVVVLSARMWAVDEVYNEKAGRTEIIVLAAQ